MIIFAFFVWIIVVVSEGLIIYLHSYSLAFIWVDQVADALERNEQVWSVSINTSH